MKRLLIVASVASMVVGCSSPESGVRLLNAHLFDATCEIDTDVSISRGSLDISASTAYNVAFDIESDLTQTETSVGGQVLQPANQNNFFVQEVVYKYSSEPTQAFPEERVNAHFVVSAGSTEGSFMTVNLIQSQASELLLASVPAGGQMRILVTFHLEGEFASGKSAKTNEVSYPILIYNSGFTGCPGSTVAPTGAPCGNTGQDSPAGCCNDSRYAGLCTGS